MVWDNGWLVVDKKKLSWGNLLMRKRKNVHLRKRAGGDKAGRVGQGRVGKARQGKARQGTGQEFYKKGGWGLGWGSKMKKRRMEN